jgi:hypothetical protein
MNTSQRGSSGTAAPETDAGDLDPRDTAHPTGQAQAEKNAEDESPHRSPTSNCACWPNG